MSVDVVIRFLQFLWCHISGSGAHLQQFTKEQTAENVRLKSLVQDLESKITTMQQGFKGEKEKANSDYICIAHIQLTYIFSEDIICFRMVLFVDVLGNGATFTRWGKESCPSNATLVYTGTRYTIHKTDSTLCSHGWYSGANYSKL
jgi:hypothetical protein